MAIFVFKTILALLASATLCAAQNGTCGVYHLNLDLASWLGASALCKNQGRELAYPSTAADRNIVSNLMTSSGIQDAWGGLTRLGRSGTDMWVDEFGHLLPNIAWDTGEPNNSGGIEACGNYRPFGGWNDRDCTQTLPYLCWGQ